MDKNETDTQEKENILQQTAQEYFSSAKEELKKERYNSAVVLFFKSLISLSDLYILQKTKTTPSSHTKRFRITQEKFPKIYDILDRNFPFYQNSYSQIMSKELAEVIKDDAKTIAKKIKIKLQ